jgi:alkaline phosphatase D
LTGLTPATTYHYQVSDGAVPASTFSATFTTAPAHSARTPWRFSSYGDLSTPITGNPSGTSWSESADNAIFAVSAIESAQPLFHLLNGDLCYANLNYNSHPAVWRDFFANVAHSAANRPWMPCLGNHEIEWGTTVGASGLAQYNGPNGYGTYLSRYDLPDNGVAGLRGNFYSFQVGTVLFISLDADDVIYQDGGSYWAPAAGVGNLTATSNSAVSFPPGSSTYNNQYTGTLVAGTDNSLVPGGTTPNRQTAWLANTLQLARQDPTGNDLYPGKLPIDMIVVQMHQCALSSSQAGNGSDLGIRQAWLPLFDQYQVDLVVSGHEHNYERSYAVRGYNPASVGTVVSPNPGQATGSVFTRQPTVVPGAQGTYNGIQAFDTSQGTVFLVLGGGGTDGPTDVYLEDSSGNPLAKVITERNQIYKLSSGAWTKSGADSTEPAPWTAQRDGNSYTGSGTSPAITTAYGYAVFDVDPGTAPGDTVITMTYYHAPAASGGSKAYAGTTTYTQFEQVVFGHASLGAPSNLPEFADPALVVGGTALMAGAAFAATRRHRAGSSAADVGAAL